MKSILFVCVENSCRSQMAEGFAKHFSRGKVMVYSAGSRPSGQVNLDAIRVMDEAGVPITHHVSKGFDALPDNVFDWVVTMGCGDACPSVLGRQRLDWIIEDPKGHDLDFFRRVRDEISHKVSSLLETVSTSQEKP